MGVLVKLRISPPAWYEIAHAVARAGQADRIDHENQTVNLSDVAVEMTPRSTYSPPQISYLLGFPLANYPPHIISAFIKNDWNTVFAWWELNYNELEKKNASR